MNQHYPFRSLWALLNSQTNSTLRHVISLSLLFFLPFLAEAQTISFDASGLAGESSNNPTSLQFGPDGRLYVSQQNGTIYAYQITRNGPNDYVVTGTEQINIVKDIPNHNDDGTPSGNSNRQITGIYVTGTGANPVLYVSSSDPRIGAGGGGNDIGLDTNSGVLSCVTCTGGIDQNGECTQWTKVDLVRGLPRSEENHAVNGMQIDEVNNILYLAVGGHTNAGAPSNNFAFTVEYTYSSTIISIDLDAIDALPTLTDSEGTQYKYNLPTLDDPTRANVNGITDPTDPNYDGVDINDPWGGNDGLNMATYDPNGPVQIHAFGFRNLYDIVITENGRMYGVDNGANGGWGGHPAGEADYDSEYTEADGSSATNNYISGEPGSGGTGPGGDDQVNNKNGLHYIRPLVSGDYNYVADQAPIYYAGHPHPIWANPDGAGLYTKGPHTTDPNDQGDDYWRVQILNDQDPAFSTQSLPANWPPVDPAYAFPAAGDFRNSGQDDNSLANYGPSTNGIAEYTASNFGGAMQGNLLLAGFNGNIYEVELSADGKVVLNCPTPPRNGTNTLSNCNESFASGFGSSPLDVIAQGDNDPFGGTVWAATYGSDNITVFEPADYDGNDPIPCTGADDDTIDEDGDGYTNADEIANGTNQCSGASKPTDTDDAFEFGNTNQFKRSDLLDTDDDNDGIADLDDPFQLDPMNGKGSIGQLPIRLELFNSTAYGFGGIGFTGIMTNGTDDYLDLIDDSGDELVFGGTAGIYTDPTVFEGDAYESNNTQKNGFQFGVDVNSNTAPFTIEAQINGPFFNDQAPQNFASHGVMMGTGDQDNYLKVVINGNSLEVLVENAGSASSNSFAVSGALDATAIRIFLSIDPAAGTVQPRYSLDGGAITDLGTPIQLSGPLLDVVQGNYTINGIGSCLAVGTIATSFDVAPEFAASWDYFRIDEDPSTAQALVEVNTGGLDGSTFSNSSFQITNNSTSGETITQVTFDLSSAIIQEVVFDPNGNAGDGTAKDLTPNNGSDVTTGKTTHSFSQAYEGGFYGLEVNFNDFDPGEQMVFGLDIDPVSIKGGNSPGPNQSGSVSGLELSGAVVTVTYSNGETQEVDLFATTGSESNSRNIVRTQLPPEPSIDMLGISNQSKVFQNEQTIEVSVGFEDVEVRLLQLEAGLFVDDLQGPYAGVGYDIDPYELNSVIVVDEQIGTTGTEGSISFDVTLTDSDPEAGFNVFAAVVVDSDGATGGMSNIIIVEYDPEAEPTTLFRINASGPAVTATDGGLDWEATGGTGAQSGDGWTVNTGNSSSHPVSGRHSSLPDYVPQSIFADERWDPPAAPEMQWNFDVDPGMYQVRLYMSNGFSGTSAIGQRVFNIEIEGQPVETGVDLVEDFGHQVGGMKEYIVTVADNSLDIEFIHDVENPTMNGIEILAFDNNEDPGAITLTPIANQSNEEGDDIGNLGVFVSASGGDGNLQYSATGLPAGIQLEPTNGQFFGVVADGAADNSPYLVEVMVDDSDLDDDDIQTITFNWEILEPAPTPDPGQILYRVNAGGAELAAGDATTPAWGQDQGNFGSGNESPYLVALSTGGSTYNQSAGSAYQGPIVRDASIPASVPDALFTTERYDAASTPEMLYSFPVAPGTMVDIDLYFAELFSQITAAGQRVFDINIEGVTAFTGVDPFAEKGALGALKLSYSTTVGADGTLDIEFIHDVENPALKGIEVRASSVEAPVITAIDNVSYGVLGEFNAGRFPIEVTDQQGDDFTVVVTGLPDGLIYDSGELTGTLTEASLTGGPNNDGIHQVTVTATDDQENESIETFTFTVVDRTITITAPQEGATLATSGFDVSWTSTGGATDVFEHVHVILIGGGYTDDGVTRLGSQPLTGTVSFPNDTYNNLTPGSYQIKVKWAYPTHVEMDETIVLPDIINVTLEEAPNVAPDVTNPGTQNSVEGGMVTLPIAATDLEDCGDLTYAAANLPAGLTIDPATGIISGTVELGEPGTEDGAWIEQNGIVVIEMENGDNLPGNWETINTYSTTFSPNVNNPTAATNGDFIIWQAGQNLGNPGNGLITYPIQITNPGTYQFKWRNQVGNGTNTTEHNDTWLKIEADQFYGSKNGGASTVCPNGAPTGTCPTGSEGPEGSSSNGWFKIYSSGANNWSWSTNTSDNDAHQIFATFDQPGTYNILISARSSSHVIDRMVLVDAGEFGANGQNLSIPESTRSQGDPGTAGAAADSPYDVAVTVSDNCDPALESTVNFTWNVLEPDMVPSAELTVTAGQGLFSSTFGNNSFILSNTGTADITNITIDASTTFMPDVVFDPVGTAGDNGAKCLTTGSAGNTAATVGLTVPGNGGSDAADCESVFQQPHNGVDNDEGYDVLSLDFTDFNPGESYAWGVDMDPTSIKGDLSTGDAGSISGFECIGAMVTITFSDGTTLTTSLFDEGSLGGADAVLSISNPAPAPSIEVVGIPTTPAATNQLNQTILVNGAPGQDITLLQVDARLYIDPGNPTVGYDVDPFEANEAIAKVLYTGTIGGNGTLNVPVTLLQTDLGNGTPLGGLNHFLAVAGDANSPNSKTSNTIVLEYDPNFNPISSLDLTIDIAGNVHEGPDQIEFYAPNTTTNPIYTYTQNSDANGLHSLANLTGGPYDIWVYRPGYLSALETITLASGANTLTVALLGGDVNNDNAVGLTDFSIMASAYGTSTGGQFFNSAADFNNDGSIGLTDFSILAGSYGLEGEMPGDNAGGADPASVEDEPQMIDVALVTKQQTYRIGETIPVDIMLEAGEQGVDGIDVSLDFDPNVLAFDRVQWTGSLEQVLQQSIDETKGQIDLASGSLFTHVQGDALIATVYFRAIGDGQTAISFDGDEATLATYKGHRILNEARPTGFEVEALTTDINHVLKGTPVIKLFPIPSDGIINLEVSDMPLQQEYTMKIFSANGQLILEREYLGSVEETFDLTDQPAGVYNLRIEAGDYRVNKVFSIQ